MLFCGILWQVHRRREPVAPTVRNEAAASLGSLATPCAPQGRCWKIGDEPALSAVQHSLAKRPWTAQMMRVPVSALAPVGPVAPVPLVAPVAPLTTGPLGDTPLVPAAPVLPVPPLAPLAPVRPVGPAQSGKSCVSLQACRAPRKAPQGTPQRGALGLGCPKPEP